MHRTFRGLCVLGSVVKAKDLTHKAEDLTLKAKAKDLTSEQVEGRFRLGGVKEHKN